MSKFKKNDKIIVLPIADDPDKNFTGKNYMSFANKTGIITSIWYDMARNITAYHVLLDKHPYDEKVFAEYELELEMKKKKRLCKQFK